MKWVRTGHRIYLKGAIAEFPENIDVGVVYFYNARSPG